MHSVNHGYGVRTEAPFSGYKSRMGRKIGMPAVNLYTEVPNVVFAEA